MLACNGNVNKYSAAFFLFIPKKVNSHVFTAPESDPKKLRACVGGTSFTAAMAVYRWAPVPLDLNMDIIYIYIDDESRPPPNWSMAVWSRR